MDQKLIILISSNNKNMKFRTSFYGISMDFVKVPWKSIKIPCSIAKKNFAAYAAINKVL